MRQWRGHSHANAAHSRESGLALSSVAVPVTPSTPISSFDNLALPTGLGSFTTT
ncbi:hypothetical protein PGTUg99_032193 [Puccinia graminis f. sp. tritici]|uniref:Uncharacterized protein n=1 Tax=Puccinia graminis f. sp. tritici TaxID=56615 RepID=A0A5B0R8M2_PUCGR|nr:hypothetical protein PGTUg99_032193 [Puccinia graminis f. sp. tritici]